MVKHCPNCGANVKDAKSRFCHNCGNQIQYSFFENLRNDWSFHYSTLFHGIIGFDLILCVGFISSFLNNPSVKGGYNDPGFIFWILPALVLNIILDLVFLYDEWENPRIIDSRLCWIKTVVAFIGIFTFLTAFYFAIITLNMYGSHQKQKHEARIEDERIRAERKIEKERWEKTKNIIRILNDTGDIRYIESYVKIYRGSGRESKEFENLKHLLATKDIQCTSEELESIIHYCNNFGNESTFEKKLLHNNPKNADDVIQNFLDLYSYNHDSSFLLALEDLLIKNFHYHGIINNDIERVKNAVELRQFEENLISESPSDEMVSIFTIDKMSGYEFEEFLKRLFEKMGYRVVHTPLSNDQGADLIVEKFGERIVIQAKNWTNNVGNSAIQEIVAAVRHYQANKAMVISSSGFTLSAIDLAESNGVELWDRQKLISAIKKNPIYKLPSKDVIQI